jgi:hypothetical protein
LHLEYLESRNVPAVAANDVYVASLYQGLLGRNTDPAGLVYWDNLLNAGATRARVALGIEHSDEFVGRAIQIYYLDFLGRPADSAGLNFWVNTVRQGSTLESVKANIFGSNEYFTHSGGSLGSFLNSVYQTELARSIDATGLSYWTRVTANTPDGRADTAFGIMHSTEGEHVEITSIYQAVLSRAPDSGGLAFWLSAFQHGATDSEVVAGILGSDEYFAAIQQFAATGSDANSAAHNFITSTHRFSGTLRGAEQLNSTIATDPSLVLPPPMPTGGGGGHHHEHGRDIVVFIPGLGSTGPFFTTGPFFSAGFTSSGPVGPVTGGFTGGGFTGGGGGFTGGGFSGGGFSGGGSGGSGGSGGGSGSLRAAIPQDQGGMTDVGGRAQGSGLYVGRGLLTLAAGTTSSSNAPVAAIPVAGVPPAIDSNSDNGLVPQLTNQQLQAIVSAALTRLQEAGVAPALLARLEATTFEVGHLPGSLLGYTFARDHTVIIDAAADGYGWFVDPTPLSDSAYVRDAAGALAATPGGPAAGHMDLLTAVLHEMGHVNGLGDINTLTHPNNLMDATLTHGLRRTDALDAIFTRGFT